MNLNMSDKINAAVGQVGAYFLSVVSFGEGVNWLGAITGLSGAALTLATAYKFFEDARFRDAERKKLERDLGK
jgi:hypothetical protein